MKFNSHEIAQVNSSQGLIGFKDNWFSRQCLAHDYEVLLLDTGNRGGKTCNIARQYVLRILGVHPIARKNVLYFECSNGHEISPYKKKHNREGNQTHCECGQVWKEHERVSRTFRFASQNLPGQSGAGDEEIKNMQYPEFMKWLPNVLLKKNLTFRNPAQVIKDPYGGRDIIIEYVSYNQPVQSQGGVDRLSVWCDEAPSLDFYEEQNSRLIGDDGDMILTYTPADRTSWLYDEIFDNARLLLKSKYIVDFMRNVLNEPAEERMETGSHKNIVVIQAASDDNPILTKESIDKKMENIDDPATLAVRRYGIFQQVSGKIFKSFDYKIHYISKDEYFPRGIPHGYTNGRGIDYHPQTPWAIGFMSLSPTNEAFVWGEMEANPEKVSTEDITEEVVHMSGDYSFKISLIDPLSVAVKKVENGKSITTRDEINSKIRGLYKEGVGTGGSFFSWDTKGEKGRDTIRLRLNNAKKVGRPFNNKVIEDGVVIYLPTMWLLDKCPLSAKSMNKWRWEQWADSKTAAMKGEKNKPEQKWSHFNMVWEALFKHSGFRIPRPLVIKERTDSRFQGRRSHG